jgi:hypothetical protein
MNKRNKAETDMNLIKQARKDMQMSQRQLGISISTLLGKAWSVATAQTKIARFERGEASLKEDEIVAASEILKITPLKKVGDVSGGEGVSPKPSDVARTPATPPPPAQSAPEIPRKEAYSFTVEELSHIDFDWSPLLEALQSRNENQKISAADLARALETATTFSAKLRTLADLKVPADILFELVKANL